jgi:hypothetical protein
MRSYASSTPRRGLITDIGRKLALLISRNVEPLARLTISSCADSAQYSKNKFDTPFTGRMAMKPWLIATAASETAR